MPGRIRVCQIINSLKRGGAEHLLIHLTKAMDDFEFTIVSLESEEPLSGPLNDAGARVVHLDERFRFDPRTIYRLRDFLSDGDFDVVHNHLPYAQTIGRLAARSVGIDAVLSTQHNVPPHYHPVNRASERLTRELDAVTIAVSQGVERAFTGWAHDPHDLGDDWCTIYNGIDVDGYRSDVDASDGRAIRDELDIGGSTPLFLSVGRYVPAKAQDVLIEAFAKVNLSDAVLVLVGHGPLGDELKRKAEAHGVADSVYVTGQVPDVEPYYAAADVFVSSSEEEGLPVTIIEAMAAELPVVASDIPGVNEVVVDGETGRLHQYGDFDTLSTILTEITPTERQSYGRAGYERARSVFDIEVTADAHRKLYRNVSGS